MCVWSRARGHRRGPGEGWASPPGSRKGQKASDLGQEEDGLEVGGHPETHMGECRGMVAGAITVQLGIGGGQRYLQSETGTLGEHREPSASV